MESDGVRCCNRSSYFSTVSSGKESGFCRRDEGKVLSGWLMTLFALLTGLHHDTHRWR